MNTTHNGFRTYHTGNSQAQPQPQEPTYDPFRVPTASGFYHNTPSTGDSRHTPTPYGNSHTGAPDTPYEHDLGSVTGLTSSSHSSIISREGPKPSSPEGKSRRFPKFKFSLTAAPPKPKPKQPGQPRPAVHVGGRGGAGNIKRIKPATPASSGEPNNSDKKAVPVSVEKPKTPHPLSESEWTTVEHGPPVVPPANREIAVPRMENSRSGNGNLYNHPLEDHISNQAVAHEDALIRQYREMQVEQVASRGRRAAVGNIKRPDDDADREYREYREYPASPQSGGSVPRDSVGRARGTGILRNKGSWTTLSSGMSDTRTAIPDNLAYPTHAHFSGEILGPVLEREDAGVHGARGYDAHLVRGGSGRKTNAGYGTPPEALMGNTRSGEPPGRSRSRTMGLPRLHIPNEAPPLPPYQSRGEGRRPSVTSSNGVEGMAGSRSQDLYALDRTPDNEPDRHFDVHSSKSSYPSHARDSQRSFLASSLPHSQRGLEKRVPHQFVDSLDSPDDRLGYARTPRYSSQTAHTSPTIVSPPTPSTVFEENPPNFFHGGNKGSKLHGANTSHLESDLHDGHKIARESGDKHRKADPEMVHKSREEGGDTMYSDIFGSRAATYLETDSVNNLREGTPFSDSSSVLIPRRDSSDALSSMVKKAQNRPTNLQRGDIPFIAPIRPTSRPRSQTREEPLHCDELNMPPQRALSKMEKAILRRVEFGQNIDLSRIQLS